MSWRDEPVTKGELVDAIELAVEAARTSTSHVESMYNQNGMAQQLVRYAGHIQLSIWEEIAEELKGE